MMSRVSFHRHCSWVDRPSLCVEFMRARGRRSNERDFVKAVYKVMKDPSSREYMYAKVSNGKLVIFGRDFKFPRNMEEGD